MAKSKRGLAGVDTTGFALLPGVVNTHAELAALVIRLGVVAAAARKLELPPERATTLLVLLSNQRRPHREAPSDVSVRLGTLLLTLTLRVFPRLAIHALGVVAPMLLPLGTVAGQVRSADTRELHALVSFAAAEDLRLFFGLDAEAELAAAVAETVELAYNRALVNAIQTAAPRASYTPATMDPEALRFVLGLVCQEMQNHRGSGRAPDASFFLVTPPEHLPALCAAGGVPVPEDVARGSWVAATVATFGGVPVTVYVDPFYTLREVLLGWRNGPADAGVTWAPYQLAWPMSSSTGIDEARGVELCGRDVLVVTESQFFRRVTLPG